MATSLSKKKQIQTLLQIALRAESELGAYGPSIFMSLSLCHFLVCPLRLEDLRDAPLLDFAHDVSGVHLHLHEDPPRLEDYFLPRFQQPKPQRTH